MYIISNGSHEKNRVKENKSYISIVTIDYYLNKVGFLIKFITIFIL